MQVERIHNRITHGILLGDIWLRIWIPISKARTITENRQGYSWRGNQQQIRITIN